VKAEDGIPADVDVYVASSPGKSEISIAAVSFNDPQCAGSFGDALRAELDRLTQANGALELMMDAHGAFISFVVPWSEEAVNKLFMGVAGKLNVSISVDHVSRSVAERLYQGRR